MTSAKTMVDIDGSRGEGGGQIVRTSLALAIVSGRAVRLRNIRARRSRPGLMRQHLVAVEAAAQVGLANVRGATLGSTELEFEPHRHEAPPSDKPMTHVFRIGTAGSSTLVCQTVLPPLLHAGGPTTLVIEGGTHNPMAPPADYLFEVFFPVLRRLGVRIEGTLVRHGFYPAGGGRIEIKLEPIATEAWGTLELLNRGNIIRRQARALLANLPRHVGRRELEQVHARLRWARSAECRVEVVPSDGPGNALVLDVGWEGGREIFTACGSKGVAAERVANQAIDELEAFVEAEVPVGPHLADQLLIPMALARKGRLMTSEPTPHTTTNAEVIAEFLPVRFSFDEQPRRGREPKRWVIEAHPVAD